MKKRNIFLVILVVLIIFAISAYTDNYTDEELTVIKENEEKAAAEFEAIVSIIEQERKVSTFGIDFTINNYVRDILSAEEKEALLKSYLEELDQVYTEECYMKENLMTSLGSVIKSPEPSNGFFTNFGIFSIDIIEVKIEEDKAHIMVDTQIWVSDVYEAEVGYNVNFVLNGDLMNYTLQKIDGGWKVAYMENVGYKAMEHDTSIHEYFEKFEDAYAYSLSKTPENILKPRGKS